MNEPLVDDVQRLVDRLAERLQQSVAIDDPHGNIIAMSRHYGDEDQYRVKLMLHRRILPEYREFFEPYVKMLVEGGGSTPLRTPPHPVLGLRGRIGFPISTADGVIAILWLVDLGRDMPSEVVASISESCDVLGAALARRHDHQAGSPSEATEDDLWSILRGRKQIDGSVRRLASLSRSEYVVVVHWTDRRKTDAPAVNAFPKVLGPAGRRTTTLATSGREDGLNVGIYTSTTAEHVDREPGDTLVASIARVVADRPAILGAGVGGPGTLVDLRSVYAEAALSAFLARHLFVGTRAVDAPSVGAIIAMLSHSQQAKEAPSVAALRAMFDEPGDFAYATIGAAIESRRIGSEWAERLHVHRTTLHYRVNQIEQRTGLDVRAPADLFLATATWLRVAAERDGFGHLLQECAARRVLPRAADRS